MGKLIKFPQIYEQTPEEQAQDLVYEAWDAVRIPEAKKLAKQALQLDPLCCDAFNVLANYEKDVDKQIAYYTQAIDAFKMRYDKVFFKENKGYFWGVLETRPYMRALAGYGGRLMQKNDFVGAIAIYQEAIQLCPNDNLGLRYALLNCLLIKNDLKAIGKLIKQYDESSFFFECGKLLYSIKNKLSDDVLLALYIKMKQSNTFATPYLLGVKKLPKLCPEYYQMGSKEEAMTYLFVGGYQAWVSDENALFKLKELDLLATSFKK